MMMPKSRRPVEKDKQDHPYYRVREKEREDAWIFRCDYYLKPVSRYLSPLLHFYITSHSGCSKGENYCCLLLFGRSESLGRVRLRGEERLWMKQSFNYPQPPVHRLYFAFYMQRNKNTFHSCEKTREFQQNIKIKGKHTSEIATSIQITSSSIMFTPHHIAFVATLFSNCHFFYRFFHSQQSRSESKNLYDDRLKSFLTLCDESTHEKNIIKFYSWSQNGIWRLVAKQQTLNLQP